MTKRIFTSVDLPDHVKEKIKSVQNPQIYPLKWMNLKNAHITLNFLGDVQESKLSAIEEIMEDAASQHASFQMSLNKFLSKRHMLWLMPMRSQELIDLKSDLSDRFREQGIGKRERHRYSPHVLIAKSKNERKQMSYKPKNFEPLDFEIESVSLYESQLTPGSATHTLIRRFPLA